MAIAALVGAAVAIWRGEWIDAVIRLVLAVAFSAWTIRRLQRPHRGPVAGGATRIG